MVEQFEQWARSRGWQIKRGDGWRLPEKITERYKSIPESWLGFIRNFDICMNEDGTIWFLTEEDYCQENDALWRYNEFELISLTSAGDDNVWAANIKEFWNEHLPIIMSTKYGEYEYYAIEMNSGNIVCGVEPEFEEINVVAKTFEEFIFKIIEGQLEL